MDIYHIFADHKEDVSSHEFVTKMRIFLDQMVSMKKMETYRITLPEFHIMMEFNNLQQLDDAMTSILENEKDIEDSHVGFNSFVDMETIQHFLYRDYPDSIS
jgi:hypothetical protein